MSRLYDRVKETSTTTGTGNFTLAGAVAQYRAFSSVYVVGDLNIEYAIVGQTGTEWEVGIGTYIGANTLQRDTVFSSSNAGALVNFSAGTKDVWVNASASKLENTGRTVAQIRGLAMP